MRDEPAGLRLPTGSRQDLAADPAGFSPRLPSAGRHEYPLEDAIDLVPGSVPEIDPTPPPLSQTILRHYEPRSAIPDVGDKQESPNSQKSAKGSSEASKRGTDVADADANLNPVVRVSAGHRSDGAATVQHADDVSSGLSSSVSADPANSSLEQANSGRAHEVDDLGSSLEQNDMQHSRSQEQMAYSSFAAREKLSSEQHHSFRHYSQNNLAAQVLSLAKRAKDDHASKPSVGIFASQRYKDSFSENNDVDRSALGDSVHSVAGFLSPAAQVKRRSIKGILRLPITRERSPTEKIDNRAVGFSASALNRKAAEQILRERKTVRFRDKPDWRKALSLPGLRNYNDPIVQRWQMGFVLVLAYETWAFPFRCALCFPVESLLFYPDCLSDLCFLLDVLAHSFIVPDKQSKRLQTRWRLFKHYFRQQFCTITVPSAIFYALSNSTTPPWLWWLAGIPRLIPRFWRLNNYFHKMQMNLKVDMKQLQIVKFITVLTLSCHWVGCAFYFLAKMLDFADNTWVGQFEETMPDVFDRELSPWWEHYLALLYRGWIGLAPNSFRRPPQNWPEQLFCVPVMFMAMTLSAYLLGTVLPHIVKKDLHYEAYMDRRKALIKFAVSRELPSSLVTKILNYYEFQSSKVRNTKMQLKMPQSLAMKVANKRFRQYVDHNCLRNFCFHGCDMNFLSAMTCLLAEVYLMPGEEFIRKGDVSRELCIVADGLVQMMDGDDVKREIRSDVVETMSTVGEVSFFLGVPHMQSGRASFDSEVRLLVLNGDDSEKLFGQYPEQEDLILRNILASFNLNRYGNTLSDNIVEDDNDSSHAPQREAVCLALKRKCEEDFTALSYAVKGSYAAEVELRLRQGETVNFVDYDKRSGTVWCRALCPGIGGTS